MPITKVIVFGASADQGIPLVNALQRRGFTPQQAASFVRALSARVDREGLERMAGGVAKAFQAPFPPTPRA